MSDGGSGPGPLERLQGALAAAGLASWVLEPGSDRIEWTDGGFAGAGWRPSEVFPSLEAWLERIHPEDRPGAAETLATARRTGAPWRHVHRVLLPGAGIARCRVGAQVHAEDGGAPVGLTGVLQGITADPAVVEGPAPPAPPHSIAEDRNRVLLRELQHRVRNSLATVRSIARNSATRGRSLEDYVEYLDGRIAAYARVQSAAIQEPLIGLDLDLLARDALGVLAVPERQVRIEGPEVSLKPRVAEQLAIAFHELATNALVHGALRSEAGRIDLSWNWVAPGGERLAIHWAETVVDPLEPEGPPGFGTEFLTRFLAYTVKAVAICKRDPSGVKWEVGLPDPRQDANAARLQAR